jgi:TetR/AcrR family transcriptional regulator, regulator of autoinduction and epiphytic fitness
MSEQSNRHYHSPRRAQQAEATREAIVRAGRALFARHGYQATTLQAIAHEAGVAVPTIYAVFGSKAAILSALVKSAGADADIRALANEAFAERDARRKLRLSAQVMRRIMERDGDIMELLWQAGGGDPDLADVWRQSHRQRLNRLGSLISQLAELGALKPGLSVEEATDIEFTLSSPETYRLMTRERGWRPQRFEEWLAETSATLLLRDGL